MKGSNGLIALAAAATALGIFASRLNRLWHELPPALRAQVSKLARQAGARLRQYWHDCMNALPPQGRTTARVLGWLNLVCCSISFSALFYLEGGLVGLLAVVKPLAMGQRLGAAILACLLLNLARWYHGDAHLEWQRLRTLP
jgi:hypothetical protein